MRIPKGPSPRKMAGGGKIGAPSLKKMKIGKPSQLKIRKPKYPYV